MREMVDEGHDCLTGTADIEKFGHLLHESWGLKQILDSGVANSTIVDLYERGRQGGAFGAKLLGAGGGDSCCLSFRLKDERTCGGS